MRSPGDHPSMHRAQVTGHTGGSAGLFQGNIILAFYTVAILPTFLLNSIKIWCTVYAQYVLPLLRGMTLLQDRKQFE